MEKLTVALSADIKDLKQSLDKANGLLDGFAAQTGGTSQKVGKEFNAMGSIAKNVGGIVAGAFAIGSITSFGKSVIDTTAEFQKFEAVLSNTLGSNSAAQLAMQSIVQFASKTPFQVNELTGAFVKLANQGFKPTLKEMTSLGDLASSTGKSFDQLVEAILDAQVSEYERLKEFGVRANDMGDKVQFTFKGVKTVVDKTSESIRDYILSLGNAVGVTGSMDKISKTLGGQLSNLSDNWTMLMKNIGDSNTGVLSKTSGLLNDIVGALNKIGSADNIAEKLGIDQRGKSWIDKIPFSEIQNLWGGITVGQSANMLLAESYDKLGKQISEAKGAQELKNLGTVLTNTRNQLEQGSPMWKVYNQRILDAADALKQLTIEQNKLNDASKQKALNDSIKAAEGLKKQADADAKLSQTMTFSVDAKNTDYVDIEKLQDVRTAVSDLQAQNNLWISGLKEDAVIGGQAYDFIAMKVASTSEVTKQKLSELQIIGQNVANSFASGFGNAFATAIIDGENFGDAMGRLFQDIGRMIIAELTKMLALKAIMQVFGTALGGPAGVAAAGAVAGGVNLGGMGRIATPRTTGLPQGGQMEFLIRGNNLVTAMNNTASKNSRLR